MFEAYEFARAQGWPPRSDTCFVLVKGCVDAGRADLAEAVVADFEGNGGRVRSGVRAYIETHRRPGAAGSGGAAVGYAAGGVAGL